MNQESGLGFRVQGKGSGSRACQQRVPKGIYGMQRDYLEIRGGPRCMRTTLRSSSWSGVTIPAQEPPADLESY